MPGTDTLERLLKTSVSFNIRKSASPYLIQRVLGLTWRPRRMSFFVDQKPEEISKNDGNTI